MKPASVQPCLVCCSSTCTDVAMTDEYNWQCTQKICLIRPDLLDLVSAGSYG